jgi:lactoylglutathione lyase
MTIQGKITGVRTVGIPVTDQDRALEFYVGTLGLEKHSGLRASGVDADDVLRWDGVPPMFAFRDLDGNGMETVEQR